MEFMIMMIPAVYRDNKKLDKKFVPDPKKVQEMGRAIESSKTAVLERSSSTEQWCPSFFQQRQNHRH